MKQTISIIVIMLFSLLSSACDCEWGGNFFTMVNQTDLVAKVKVINKMKDKYDFNVKMEVEIIETFKGQENRKIITIWGDNGNECRPYIDYFETECVYYLSLSKFGTDYEQMNCGEMFLKIDNNKIIPDKEISKNFERVGAMNINEFELKLKERIK